MATKLVQRDPGNDRRSDNQQDNSHAIAHSQGSAFPQLALMNLIRAILKKDFSAISRLVAKSHIGITSRGCTFSSRELEKKAMEMEILQYEVSNLSSRRVANNEVLFLFDAQIHASWNGLHDEGWFNVISLWSKGVKGWQEVFYQETPKKD